MTITFVGAGTLKTYSENTQPATVDLPDSMAVGDIIFVHGSNNSSNAITLDVAAAADGWAMVAANVLGGTHSAALAWKRADADDVAAATVAVFNHAAPVNNQGQAFAYRGALLTGTPFRDVDSDISASNTTVTSELETTEVGDWIVSCVTNSSVTDMTQPPTYTLRGGTVSRSCFSDKVQGTTGSTGAITPTTAGLSRRTSQFAVALMPEPDSSASDGSVILGGVRVPRERSVLIGGVRVPVTRSVILNGTREPIV